MDTKDDLLVLADPEANTAWPPDEILKIAKSSGKPLEVSCALAFQQSEWVAHLGSYFADSATGIPRELDVLATKQKIAPTDRGNVQCRVRALVSCKGFPPNCSPVAYSVARSQLAATFRGLSFLNLHAVPDADVHAMENASATTLVTALGLTHPQRRLVAYDVVRRDEPNKKGEKSPTVPTYQSIKDTWMYSGLDSALKASLHWRVSDGATPGAAATLYVPVLVLGSPFWDVPIDDGVPGTPTINRRGYQTCIYPVAGNDEPLTTLVLCRTELPEFVEALDELLEWLIGVVQSRR